jgi:hypothetical protein
MLKKWIDDTGMQNASDFYPKNEKVMNSANFKAIRPQITEILEKSSSGDEENTPTKSESRFSRMRDCDKTT